MDVQINMTVNVRPTLHPWESPLRVAAKQMTAMMVTRA